MQFQPIENWKRTRKCFVSQTYSFSFCFRYYIWFVSHHSCHFANGKLIVCCADKQNDSRIEFFSAGIFRFESNFISVMSLIGRIIYIVSETTLSSTISHITTNNDMFAYKWKCVSFLSFHNRNEPKYCFELISRGNSEEVRFYRGNLNK